MRQFLFLFLAFLINYSVYSQVININGMPTVLTTTDDVPDDLKAIQYKKYAFKDYKACYVDDNKERAFLRYNIFDDQMEFVKDGNIYYLVKDEGRYVRFADNTNYKVYNLNGEKGFFLVHSDGKNALVAKQGVRFVEAKKAQSGYEADKPADYKRRKDVLYFDLEGKGLVKVPTKKKEFFSVFGSNSTEVKSFMKKNKVGYKKEKDLKKILNFLNSK